MAKFLTKEQEASIIESIAQAERETSGEIRIHIEKKCSTDSPIERARQVFEELGMHETDLRNGVIIYIAFKDHKLAIWGDEGIHSRVGQSFWEEEYELLKNYFREQDYETGLTEVILQIGQKLKENFPYQEDDINELTNDISYEDPDGEGPDA